MTDPIELPDADDERRLFALVKRERLARDTSDWAALAAAYQPGARVRVTWFDGTAEDFIAVSKERERRGGSGMHHIEPIWAEVDGDRALVESRGQIILRPPIDGVRCDVTSWCRFFARAERREGVWRLTLFDSIYVKDRVDPVDPSAVLVLDAERLAEGRESYRHLTYLNRAGGYTVSPDLPGVDRPDLVEAFYAEARSWLHGA